MAEQKQRNPRLSLTKTQLQTAIGAELLSLCQTITEDGSLQEEEISALNTWLQENRNSDLPSIEFLTGTVEQILRDGKVTKEEVDELYKAIELILPAEVRKGAAIRRRVARAAERQRAREEREAQKKLQREEMERNRPISSLNFMVAGVRYEGRPRLIAKYVRPDDTVFLVRDRNNRFSRNAVEVRTRHGYQIGFVPENYAIGLAPLLDKGCSHVAFITKVLTGGRSPIPVVQAYVHRADSTEPGAVFEKDVPAKKQYAVPTETEEQTPSLGATEVSSGSRGWVFVFLVAFIVIIAMLVFGKC